jgi:predicted HTH domain antitoxin
LTLTIPDDRLRNIALTERDAVIDVAIGLYKRQLISIGKAAEVAGISTPEILHELGQRQIPINYGPDDLKHDLKTLDKLA